MENNSADWLKASGDLKRSDENWGLISDLFDNLVV